MAVEASHGGGECGGPRVVTVTGSKGGVGCSLLSAALVAAWRSRGRKAILAQLGGRFTDELALLYPGENLVTCTGSRVVGETSSEACGPWLFRLSDESVDQISMTLDCLLRLDAPLVVIDSSGGTSELAAKAWQKSDLVLGIGTADLLGVRSLTGLVKNVFDQGLTVDRCGLVLNRVGLSGGVQTAEAGAVLGGQLWGVLPDSIGEVSSWLSRGLPSHPGASLGGRLGEAVTRLALKLEGALSRLPVLPGPCAVDQAWTVRVTDEAKQRMRRRLMGRLGELGADQDPAVRRRRVTEEAAATVREVAGTDSLYQTDLDRITAQLVDELIGLGAIESLVRDPMVTEVMINGPDRVYFEKEGRLHLAECRFSSPDEVVRLVDRVVSPLGRRIDESSPMVDARLPDGSRLNAVIPPLALDGPSVTIRRFGVVRMTVANLVARGALSEELAERLCQAVMARKNILLSGGAGTGKTTLLNALSGFIPAAERIITIEDAAELRLQQEHVVRLEARPPNVEGKGAISIRDLVRNALRMRPDRIIVGEVRGLEALDMLQAMNTGHTGSLATIHANSAYDALSRLETMVLMTGVALPLRVVREQVGAAIDLVVHLVRGADGERRTGEALSVTGVAGGRYLVRQLVDEEESHDAVG